MTGVFRATLVSVLLCAGIEFSADAQPIIQTVAGTDLVFQGSRKPATGVSLGRISRVTVDPNGRPVFTDPNYHLVFRIESDGTIRVIAGNNVQGLTATSQLTFNQSGGGYSGDGGPAVSAALNRPEGVAYDTAGNLYIADTFNQRIRMVNPQGVISTIAGTGQAGFQGDGGPALGASLNFPTDLAVDASGNIYVGDNQNFRIRKISPQGSITTIAGTGTAGAAGENVPAASSPIGDVEALAVDSQGNLYLAEFSSDRVRRISGGVVTTVAGNGNEGFTGDGPALTVSLNRPAGLAFDSSGNLLIADTGNLRVRKLAGGALTTIAGTGQEGFSGDGGPALKASLHNPFGIAAAGTGDIYFADRDNFRIRHVDGGGAISTAAGDGRLIPSQNGVSASLATLLDPFGVSFNSQGAMLVADTHNDIIRRLNSDGTLATIAGTGAQESSGDNGPATQAAVLGPFSVTADSSGNLYEAEADANLVRRIGTNGLISTVAGGTAQSALSVPTQAVTDSSGNLYIADFLNNRIVKRAPDGTFTRLPATFTNPGGVAIDALGNLYVTEWGAGLVRRVSPTGTVSTVAGGGNIAGGAADGGPAVNARLGRPGGVAVDGAGNVYFTDVANGSIRKVAMDGTISTIAGNGRQAFSGDGGPAPGASLNGPWGLTLDSSGALYVADVLNNRIRKILLNSAPTFALSTQSAALTASSDGAVSDPVTVTATGSLTGLLFTVSADQPWLAVEPGGGAMPATVQVTADPTGLVPGSYTGNVTFTALGANPATRTVAVTFTVGAAAPPDLKADTQGLGFSFVAGADPASRQVTLRNAGSGSVTFSASASMASGSAWLTVSPASGSATSKNPQALTVTVTPGQLPPGTYNGAINVSNSATGATISIPVAAAITAPASKLVLSQTGLVFRAVSGGGVSLPRTFGVLNTGQGSMNWTAAATTLSGGSWLSASPTSGVVATPLTDVSQVSVAVDPSGLGPGTYYGRIDVNAAGNAVQTVTVELDVLAAGTPAPPDVYPSGLIFTGTQGSNPGSQTIAISNLTAQAVNYSSSRSTQSGTPWFVHVPSSGVIAPNQPANIVVQPDFTNVPAGVSQGSLTLLFSDGSTRVVSVLAVVASGSGATPTLKGERKAAAGCSPSSLTIQPVSLPSAFSASLNQATTLEVLLADNCGGPVTPQRAISNGLKVWASFSDGDRNVNFTHTGNGDWNTTWLPLNGSTGSSVTVTITVLFSPATGGLLYNQVDLKAKLAAASAAPVLTPGAIVNGASFQSNVPVAPGTIISIFGSNLADGVGIADDAPLPLSLRGTQVAMGGRPLPLRYTSTGQLNALVPYEVPVNTQLQVLVQHGTDLSVGDVINVAAAQPAIFTQNQAGTGQGAIVNGVTNVLADTSAPVAAGDVITIYCTGLGMVDPPIPSGTAAPLDTLSYTTHTVTASVGGLNAQVTFAGLAPGYAGLYQVNAVVPQGVTAGNEVPVQLSVAGQTSRPVTIAVH